MPVPDQYRRHADECVRVAQMINDPVDKTLLLQMAQAWRRLAKRAEAQKTEADQDKD
jgi:hypothetical protein